MRSVTKAILIEGGRIIDPGSGLDDTGDLLIRDGKIVWMSKPGMTPINVEHDVIDAAGMIVCPGFIDLHCHLRQPGYENKETIATGTRAAAKGGFTTVCAMPNTKPPVDSVEMVKYIKETADKKGRVRVLPIGCITKGRQGRKPVDMAGLAAAGAVALSDDGSPVIDDHIMIEALKFSAKSGIPVIDHCENTGMSDGWDMNGGELARELGLRGMPERSEESMIERDIKLNRDTGGVLHIAHVSTAESVEIIRKAKQAGIRITAEVTPNHLTLSEMAVKISGNNAKVNPPLRTQRDITALIAGLLDGTIAIIATDHAPHTVADKSGSFGKAAFGISSLETALGGLMTLVHNGNLPLKVVLKALTAGPAALLGSRYGEIGTLTAGSPADITVFDPEFSWTVDPAKFESKGKNTPLAGVVLKGKVMLTVYRGRTVYRNEALKIDVKG